MKAIFLASMIGGLNLACSSEPLVLKDIPEDILRPCKDEHGRIADRDKNWNQSDFVDATVKSLPRARLVDACKGKNHEWTVICQKGGYTSKFLLVKAKHGKTDEPASEKPVVKESRVLPYLKCD
jgi:hypothetical protein